MQETLLVLPNPYVFIDGDGEPQGACPADGPNHARGKRMWIGAKLDTARTKHLPDYEDRPKTRRGGKDVAWSGDSRPRPQTTKFVFSAKPVEIPETPHYLDRIRCGELVAADEATFAKAFGGRAKFRAPEAVLAEKRARAFDDFKAAYGKAPAFSREEAPPKTTAAAMSPADAPTALEGVAP
jgi:hypothetical protein